MEERGYLQVSRHRFRLLKRDLGETHVSVSCDGEIPKVLVLSTGDCISFRTRDGKKVTLKAEVSLEDLMTGITARII